MSDFACNESRSAVVPGQRRKKLSNIGPAEKIRAAKRREIFSPPSRGSGGMLPGNFSKYSTQIG